MLSSFLLTLIFLVGIIDVESICIRRIWY